mmetsp:Transcript_21782/g.36051  ORF Transcript_21782/g.36051 Transcript_21782/m.36051 type:complete len:563 (+) Transcript_21782:97-1785(+)
MARPAVLIKSLILFVAFVAVASFQFHTSNGLLKTIAQCPPSQLRMSSLESLPIEQASSDAPRDDKPASVRRAEEWFENCLAEGLSCTPVADALAPLKEQGAALLADLKIPSRRDEPYRYSDLESLYRTKYEAAMAGSGSTGDSADALVRERALGGGVARGSLIFLPGEAAEEGGRCAGRRLVFVDGVFEAALSDLADVPAGVVAGSVAALSAEQLAAALPALSFVPELGADNARLGHENKRTCQGSAPFGALNLAALQDAAVLLVPEGVDAGEKPFEVMFIASSEEAEAEGAPARLSSHRLAVVAGAGARLALVQHACGLGSRHLANGLARVEVGAGAAVRHALLQEHPAAPGARQLETVCAEVGEDGRYEFSTVALGGGDARLNVQVELSGERAHCGLRGAAFGGQDQNLAMYTTIRHNAEATTTEQVQRNVLGKNTDVVWKGRIRVEEVAQQTDADQLCASLMLSDQARVTAMPSMEIIADQVKCTHGATVSDMSEEELFYFAARGIGRQMARELIVLGFADEAAEEINCEKFQARLTEKVQSILPPSESRTLGAIYQSI